MRKSLIGLGVVLGVGIIIVGAVGLLARPVLERQFVRYLESIGGGSVAIRGTASLSSLAGPLTLHLTDVVIEDATGDGRAYQMTVPAVDAEVTFRPFGEPMIELARLSLADPHLRISAPSEPVGSTSAGIGGRHEGILTALVSAGLSPAHLEVDAGTLVIDRDPDRPSIRLSHIALDARRRDATGATGGSAYAFDARARWAGRPLSLTGLIEDGAALAAGAETRLRLDADIAPALWRFDGIVGAQPASVILRGWVSGRGPSFRDAMAWIDRAPAAPADLLGPFAVRSRIEVGSGLITLDQLRVSLDGMQLAGALIIDNRRTRPYLKGQLTSRYLDLGGYLFGAGASVADEPAPAREQGASSRLLPAIDMDLALTARTLRIGGLELLSTAATVSLLDNRLTMDLDEFQAFGGSGMARIVRVDGDVAPTMEANVLLNGVETRSLLATLVGHSPIEAKGSAYAVFSGKGQSPAELLSTLGGSIVFRLDSGSISGLDLAATAWVDASGRNLRQTPRSASGTTDFSQGLGVLRVRSGVARAHDVTLETPDGRFRAAGSVNLMTRTMDLRIEPTNLVTSPQATAVVPQVTELRVAGPPDTKPADTKPAGTKPAGTQPEDTRPGGTKPAETKRPGTKPAGTNVAGTGPHVLAVSVSGPWSKPTVDLELDAPRPVAAGDHDTVDPDKMVAADADAAGDLMAALERLPWIPVSRTGEPADVVDPVATLHRMLGRLDGAAH